MRYTSLTVSKNRNKLNIELPFQILLILVCFKIYNI